MRRIAQYHGAMTIDVAIDRLRNDGHADLAASVDDERNKFVAEIDKLRSFISYLQRAQFGSKSEKLSPDQLQLALEETEQSAAAEAAGEQADAEPGKPKRRKKPRTPLRGALPSHLPREHVTVVRMHAVGVTSPRTRPAPAAVAPCM